jgi:Ca2+/Na+ antiporter
LQATDAQIDLQVAFAGHRHPEEFGEGAAIEAQVLRAFELLKAASIKRARLLTGLADGADQIALKAWRTARMGTVHAVLPFLLDTPEGLNLENPDETVTWLDGASENGEGINPHLIQTRWLVSPADILVVVWNGLERRGPGGTADAVRLAFDAGIPTLWISPNHPEPQLITRPPKHKLVEFVDLLDALAVSDRNVVVPANAETLRQLLKDNVTTEQSEFQKARQMDAWLHRWLWRAFAVFQRQVGGSIPPPARKIVTPPPDLLAQPGFAVITQALEEADTRASRLSAVHRSEQLLLLCMAVLAAILGALSLLTPAIKMVALIAELFLALCALGVWWTAAKSRQHEKWTDARRLAEQLRYERVGWVIGVASRERNFDFAERDQRRIARAIVRQALPATGRFDQERIAAWVPWVIDELIVGQADYHHQQGKRNHRIAHRMELLETLSFAVLLVALAIYIVAWAVLLGSGHHVPTWGTRLIGALGVIVPAIAAATMALEAKFQFEEQAQRSAILSGRLQKLLSEIGSTPGLSDAQGAVRAASELLGSEADLWHEGGHRRRLVRGG